jgi:hypothetical protein
LIFKIDVFLRNTFQREITELFKSVEIIGCVIILA